MNPTIILQGSQRSGKSTLAEIMTAGAIRMQSNSVKEIREELCVGQGLQFVILDEAVFPHKEIEDFINDNSRPTLIICTQSEPDKLPKAKGILTFKLLPVR